MERKDFRKNAKRILGVAGSAIAVHVALGTTYNTQTDTNVWALYINHTNIGCIQDISSVGTTDPWRTVSTWCPEYDTFIEGGYDSGSRTITGDLKVAGKQFPEVRVELP